jgi:hypothetical protein
MTTDSNGFNHTNEQEHNEFCSAMIGFMDSGKPQVGIFWYDSKAQQLFGIEKTDADKTPFINGKATISKLHKTYWQKQHHRAVKENNRQSIFYKEHNYTMIPRGRIFLDEKTKVFQVCVGHWVNDLPDLKEFRYLIEDEFNLPENFEFVIDIHWDLGHGWSEELV